MGILASALVGNIKGRLIDELAEDTEASVAGLLARYLLIHAPSITKPRGTIELLGRISNTNSLASRASITCA